jgi:uncharacterized protein RhaS with RHS repeats
MRVDLSSGDVVTSVHDPLIRRIPKKVNGTVTEKYLWQGRTRLLAVSDGSDALVQRFEYADGRRPPVPVAMTVGSTRYFPVYDQAGLLRAVVDGSGSVVKTAEYDSFGNVMPTATPPSPFPSASRAGSLTRTPG